MSDRRSLFGYPLLAVILIAACSVGVLRIDMSLQPDKRPAPVRERNLGEEIVLTQSGLYGVSLVKVGKAHMRKLRKGPFTVGAINELVLEDVELTIPVGIEGMRDEGRGMRDEGRGASGAPADVLDRLGVEPNSLHLGGKLPRFSALAIRNLKVARLTGTNAVPWFAAAHAEAKRGGLSLSDGWSVEDGRRTDWQEALLVLQPELRVVPRQ